VSAHFAQDDYDIWSAIRRAGEKLARLLLTAAAKMRDRATGANRRASQQWLRVAVFAVVVGLALYSAWQQQRTSVRTARPTTSTSQPDQPDQSDRGSRSSTAPTGRIIANQTIRDSDEQVVFRGDIDVGPTLQRIHRGDQLRFSHDGIVFENRERRLPKEPSGYYHEFVHPTPGLSGPGPQRIIVGRENETYYTPDHYRTFQRLDE
jgi:guanyl-specific ribonuclease Sa